MQDNKDHNRLLVTLVRSDMAQQIPYPELRRRTQWMALLFLGLLMTLSAMLLWNSNHIFNRFEARSAPASGNHDKIRFYNQQLASLQERMTGFIADSVETRLRTLEQRVAAGTVGAAEIRAFEDLRNELLLLESYSSAGKPLPADFSRQDHPRFHMSPGAASTSYQGDLLGEVVELKTLTYFSIASCGLVALMIGGYWWQQNSRIKRLAPGLERRPLLVRGSTDPQ